MKFMTKFAVLAVGLLIAAPQPAASQVTPSGSSSIFRDLIAKGRRDLDDFNYTAASAVWQQLLAQPLSRQQRIDVLQLIAATMFPNDSAEQKRDSASSVIRQLVGMGVRRMVVKDVSHPGLDALYSSIVASAGAANAPTVFDSARHVVALVTEGYQLDEVTDRVTIDCYTFSFDELEQGLRRSRLAATLPGALKRTCSQILVESDPPNTTLTVGTRDFGTVPDRGQLRWVMPEPSIEIAVASGQSRVAKVVEVPQGKLLQAKFYLPKDTVFWPAVRTPQQIADDLRIFERFTPSSPKPAQPVKPSSMGAFATGMLWGLVGGAAGFAVGQFLPAAKCTVNETVPAGRTARYKGKTYNAGETVNLGGGMPCVATLAGGTGAGVFLFTATIKGSKNRSKMAKYNEATRAYPAIVKEWEERERRTFAERHPEVRQALADQQAKLDQTQSENANIRARNANLPQPEITVRELEDARKPASPGTPPGQK
jgi:hypothetical protein